MTNNKDPWATPEQSQEKSIYFSYKRTDRVVMANIPPHGQFTLRPQSLENLFIRYHEWGTDDLKNKLARHSMDNGMDTTTYDDLTTKTECLMVLGEFEGYNLP